MAAATSERGMGGVLYVDDDAAPAGDGLTWQTAHRFLQDALAHAADPTNGVTEIRLAQGVYKPDQGQGQTPGDRNATFQIASGLALRGGYAGLSGGPDPDARDWEKFESVCSGDLFGNDGALGSWQGYTENSLHICTALASTLIEGVTFYGSNHDSFVENDGGGIVCTGTPTTIAHCLFRGNSAYYGGGVSVRPECITSITVCQFQSNRACRGGAVATFAPPLSTPGLAEITRCSFIGNTTFCGAGTASAVLGNTKIIECNFNNNFGFQATTGTVRGGPQNTVTKSTFLSNYADGGGGIAGTVVCTDSDFIENVADYGGGIESGLGTFRNCRFIQNFAFTAGGAISMQGGSQAGPFVVDCLFESNVAWHQSGGAIRGKGTIINSYFFRNDCWLPGGSAVSLIGNASIVNCLMSSNTASYPSEVSSGAVWAPQGTSAAIINSTIADNWSPLATGGINAVGPVTIDNSIVWNNSAPQISGRANARYSCIQWGWPGEGNILDDPVFFAAGIDDYRLRGGSPCIDAGDNLALPTDLLDLDGDGDTTEPVPIDLLGQRRYRADPHAPNSGLPGYGLPPLDMGSCEYQLRADINQDGIVNVNDLLAVINSWGACANRWTCPADVAPYPNGNGVVNHLDLLDVVLSWGE